MKKDKAGHFFNLYRHGFVRVAVCTPEDVASGALMAPDRLPPTEVWANPGATPEPTADAPPPPEPPNTADSREARWVAVPFCTG